MKHLLFDFNVDMNSNTVFINREFDAELPLVWDAFTKQEILDQWWAPQPYQSKTKYMDFKVGGRRFYAMVSPEGHEHWSVQEYKSITPKSNFKFFSAFSDKDENLQLPGSDWDLEFTGQDEPGNLPGMEKITRVSITIKNESRERMQQMIEMGFKEGFTMTLNYLETLLQQLKK